MTWGHGSAENKSLRTTALGMHSRQIPINASPTVKKLFLYSTCTHSLLFGLFLLVAIDLDFLIGESQSYIYLFNVIEKNVYFLRRECNKTVADTNRK